MSFIDEVRATTAAAKVEKEKEFLKSYEFKREAEILKTKIKKAAREGKNYVREAIVTSHLPYDKDPFIYEQITNWLKSEGFEIRQTRCADGIPYAEHYDVCWN